MTLLFIPSLMTALLAGVLPFGGRNRSAIATAAIGAWLALAAALVTSGIAIVIGNAVDGLAIVLVALTLFVGAIVLSFSSRYLRADARPQSYATKILLLLSAIQISILADHVALFAIAWLASGWFLASLIGHVADWDEARMAARRTLVRLAVGDLMLVAALALLCRQAGSMRIEALVAGAIAQPGIVTFAAAIMLVIAAMARCALPPFSSWLTLSMTAPTPVSALMHAGFVNAGGFLLIRFGPVIEAAPSAQWLAIAAGLVAALWGTGIMLVRPDIKRSLAGSTVAQMGFMLMTCGLAAYAAALWHLVAHGLFKAWLFLGSGSAIGAQAPAQAERTGPLALAASALIALAGGALALSAGLPEPALVPVVLAIATALATLAGMQRSPVLALPVLAIIAIYGGGLWLTEHALVRPYGNPPGGPVLAIALIAIFFLSWLLQAALQRSGRSLPPGIYARLLGA